MLAPYTIQKPKLEDFTLQHSYMQTPIGRSQIFSPVYDDSKKGDKISNSPKRIFGSFSHSYSEMPGS
jgi:hypothetical protein